MVAVSVFLTLIVINGANLTFNPVNLFLKLETKSDYLEKFSKSHAAIEYIKKNLPDSARVLMLYDGRGYYCDQRCLPDIDQSRWTTMVQHSPSIKDMAIRVKKENITHILYNKEDAEFFLNEHDPTGKIKEALDFFKTFSKSCLKLVYQDKLDFVTVYYFDPELHTCK